MKFLAFSLLLISVIISHDSLANSSWYFDYTAKDLGDGSLKHPFNPSQFTAVTISKIKDLSSQESADLYFNGGEYNSVNFPYGIVSLPNNFSVYGRNIDFTKPALENDRPVFNASMRLNCGNNNLDSIILKNDFESFDFEIALQILNAKNVILNNIEIGEENLSKGFITGMFVSNSDISIANSKILAFTLDDDGEAEGIVVSQSNLKLIGNNFIFSEASSEASNGVAIGIDLGNHSNIFATSSYNSIECKNSSHDGLESYGISISNSRVVFKNASFNVFSDQEKSPRANSYDVFINNLPQADPNSIFIGNSKFMVSGSKQSTWGVWSENGYIDGKGAWLLSSGNDFSGVPMGYEVGGKQ